MHGSLSGPELVQRADEAVGSHALCVVIHLFRVSGCLAEVLRRSQ